MILATPPPLTVEEQFKLSFFNLNDILHTQHYFLTLYKIYPAITIPADNTTNIGTFSLLTLTLLALSVLDVTW